MKEELLKTLCAAPGVSGCEEKIRQVIAENICCDAIETDAAGNLICIKKSDMPNAPAILLDAHMDTVGLCVKEVCERGFLKVSPVGGVDERLLPAACVTVHGKEDVFGVIATKPPHLMDSADKATVASIDMMFVDTGNRAEGILVGDRISYRARFDRLLGSVSAPYLDNRLGCCAIIELFSLLKDEKLPFDVKAVFTVGEEPGLKGAKSTDLKADLALILDVTFGKTPDEKSDEALEVGGGAAIGTGPNLHKAVTKDLIQCAKQAGCRHQLEVLGCSGTNAWSYQTLGFGIPCGLLSIPIKYMHTPAETVKIADYDSTLALLEAYVRTLTPEKIREISEVKVC